MIRTKLTIFADNVIIDQARNAVSIIDVIEEINTPTFPIVIPRMIALWMAERDQQDPEQHRAELVLEVNGIERNRFAVALDFKGKLRTRTVITFGGYLVTEPGTLRAVFLMNGQDVGSYDIAVNTVAAPQVEVRPTA